MRSLKKHVQKVVGQNCRCKKCDFRCGRYTTTADYSQSFCLEHLIRGCLTWWYRLSLCNRIVRRSKSFACRRFGISAKHKSRQWYDAGGNQPRSRVVVVYQRPIFLYCSILSFGTNNAFKNDQITKQKKLYGYKLVAMAWNFSETRISNFKCFLTTF